MKSAFEIYPISVPIQSEKKKICFFIDSTSSLSFNSFPLTRFIRKIKILDFRPEKLKVRVKTLNKKKAPLKKGPCRDGHPWPKKAQSLAPFFQILITLF